MISNVHICFLSPECWRDRFRWGIDMPMLRISWQHNQVFHTLALWPDHFVQVYDWQHHGWTSRWSWHSSHPLPGHPEAAHFG